MRKPILWIMALLCVMLPSGALGVTEGMVEAAPQVVIELETKGDALFGAWEQGLADIERAARSVLEERLNCPKDMTLYHIDVGSDMHAFGMGTGQWREEDMRSYIYISFLFFDERMGGSMSAQVGFDFETGKLGSCRVGRWYEGEEGTALMEKELPQGSSVQIDSETRKAMLDDYLQNALGLCGYTMTEWGQATFPDGSRMSATIGHHTKNVIAVMVDQFGEEAAVQ